MFGRLFGGQGSFLAEILNLMNGDTQLFGHSLGRPSAIATDLRNFGGGPIGASRGDVVGVADPSYHSVMKHFAPTAFNVATVEFLGDGGIGERLGLIADEIDDGCGGLDGFVLGTWMIDGEKGRGACFPMNFHVNGSVIDDAAESHVLDQNAKEAFLILVGGGRRVPESGEIFGESRDVFSLQGGESEGGFVLLRLEVALNLTQDEEFVIPLRFQATRDEAVFGFDDVELAGGAFRLVARSFKTQVPMTRESHAISFNFFKSLERDFQMGGLERFKECLGDGDVDGGTLDILAGGGGEFFPTIIAQV